MKDQTYQPMPFTALVRPRCPECGAGRLRWYPLGEAFDVMGAAVVEGLLNSADGGFVQGDDLEFWTCRQCKESGLVVSPADMVDLIREPSARAWGGDAVGGRDAQAERRRGPRARPWRPF